MCRVCNEHIVIVNKGVAIKLMLRFRGIGTEHDYNKAGMRGSAVADNISLGADIRIVSVKK